MASQGNDSLVLLHIILHLGEGFDSQMLYILTLPFLKDYLVVSSLMIHVIFIDFTSKRFLFSGGFFSFFETNIEWSFGFM